VIVKLQSGERREFPNSAFWADILSPYGSNDGKPFDEAPEQFVVAADLTPERLERLSQIAFAGAELATQR